MRKTAAILLILLLLSPAAAWARTLTCRDLFSIEYPPLWIDYGADPSYDVEGESYSLGFIGGFTTTSLNIGIDAVYLPDYRDIRLFSADEDTVLDFAEMVLDNYDDAELIDVVRISEYEIPFIVYRFRDEAGESIVAETLANGWNLVFFGYAYADADYEMCRDLSESDIQTFMNVVTSFVPIVK